MDDVVDARVKSHAVELPERGAVMMEFALSVGVFLFFVIVAIESLRFGYTILSAQYLLSAVAREAAVHTPTDAQLDPLKVEPLPACSGDPACDPRVDRANFIRTRLSQLQSSHLLNLTSPPSVLRICPVSAADCATNSNNGGLPDQMMKLELLYSFRFVAFGIGYTTTITTVYRNQSYEARKPVS